MNIGTRSVVINCKLPSNVEQRDCKNKPRYKMTRVERDGETASGRRKRMRRKKKKKQPVRGGGGGGGRRRRRNSQWEEQEEEEEEEETASGRSRRRKKKKKNTQWEEEEEEEEEEETASGRWRRRRKKKQPVGGRGRRRNSQWEEEEEEEEETASGRRRRRRKRKKQPVGGGGRRRRKRRRIKLGTHPQRRHHSCGAVPLTIVKTVSAPAAKGDRHSTSHVTNVNIEKNCCCGRGKQKSISTNHHPSVLDMDLTAESSRAGLSSADVFWRLGTT